MSDRDDEDRFDRICEMLSRRLCRYGLRPSPNKRFGGNTGWGKDIAFWKRDRARIYLYFDGMIDPKKRHLWWGFQSRKKSVIDQLRDELSSDYSPVLFVDEDWDWVSDQIKPAKKQEIILNDGLVLEQEGTAKYYFGKYDVSDAADDTVLDKAEAFIRDVIESITPELAEERDEKELAEFRKNDPTTYKQLILARRGQGKFRADLDNKWDSRCAVHSIKTREVLRASHMKPWWASTSEERLDGNNGLLLSAILDALFDRGLITFNEVGEIKLSQRLAASDRDRLKLEDLTLRKDKSLSQSQLEYLAYHNKYVFR